MWTFLGALNTTEGFPLAGGFKRDNNVDNLGLGDKD